MATGVIDANIALAWIQGTHRAAQKIGRLFAASRAGHARLVLSVVNLAEVIRHTAELSRVTGVDPRALLSAARVEFHRPDEAIAYRVARLQTSLADGFAAATALELNARLHTADRELVAQLKSARLSITCY